MDLTLRDILKLIIINTKRLVLFSLILPIIYISYYFFINHNKTNIDFKISEESYHDLFDKNIIVAYKGFYEKITTLAKKEGFQCTKNPAQIAEKNITVCTIFDNKKKVKDLKKKIDDKAIKIYETQIDLIYDLIDKELIPLQNYLGVNYNENEKEVSKQKILNDLVKEKQYKLLLNIFFEERQNKLNYFYILLCVLLGFSIHSFICIIKFENSAK